MDKLQDIFFSVWVWVVSFLIYCMYVYAWEKRRQLPPGPRGWPLVGSLPEMVRAGEHAHSWFAKLAHIYGPILHVRLGATSCIVVSDASLAKIFLGTQLDCTFASRPPLELVRRMHYGPASAFSMGEYGPNWRHMRKLCALHLSSQQLVQARLLPVALDEIKHTLLVHLQSASINNHAHKEHLQHDRSHVDPTSDRGDGVKSVRICGDQHQHDERHHMYIEGTDERGAKRQHAYAKDHHDLHDKPEQDRVVAQASNITHQVGCMYENILGRVLVSKRMSEVVHEQLGLSLADLTNHITVVLEEAVIGDIMPWMGYWLDGRVKRHMNHLHGLIDALLEPLLAQREALDGDGDGDAVAHAPDFLESLLSSGCDRDQIKTALLELLTGLDTLVAFTDWAMAEVLSNRRVLSKLQKEVDELVKGKDRIVQDIDLINLSYLDAVMKETLRLHPPLPLMLPHMSMQDSQACGYHLPKGTRLFINLWAMGRDPKVWEDPLTFTPERFLNKNLDPEYGGQNFAFGAGRRSCIATSFALPFVKLTLANLVLCFEWSSPLPIDMVEKSSTVMCRKEPLMAIPRSRVDSRLFSTPQ